MKRLLSILLSVMLILGTMSVTVFADAPELTLVATNTLSGISSNTFADKDKYVLFNAIEGATYKNNGVAATVITNPLNKADFVALKVDNTGVNMFTAEVDGVASNSVNVYGVQTTTGTVKTSNTGSTDVDVEAIEDAELKEALSQRENVAYYAATSGSTIKTVYATDTATYRIKNSVYINQDTLNSYVGLLRTNKYAAIRADLSIYLEGTGSNKGGYDTGFDAVTYAWNDFEYVHYKYTVDGAIVGKADVYFNNILIGKSLGSYAAKWAFLNTMVNEADRSKNVYHTKNQYSNDTIPYTPTLTATADEENDTVTVTGTDVDEFTNYTAKVFVNGVATEDIVTVNASDAETPVATTISVPKAQENAKVYVAYVDADNNVLNAFEPVKTAELTFATIEATETLTKLSFSLVTDDVHMTSVNGAMVGSKIRFNEASTISGYTVKYFNNGTEVQPTAVSEGVITLPVSAESNSYVAKVYQDGVYVPGYDSDPVAVTGLALSNGLSTGSFTSARLSTTTPAAAGIAGINGDTSVNIGTYGSTYGYWNAGAAFTNNPDYDVYLFSADAYVKTTDGVLNNASGTAADYVSILSLRDGTGGSSYGARQWILVGKDGKVAFGGNSTISNVTYTNHTVSLDAWHTYTVLLHKETGYIDLYVDDVLVAKDYLSNSTPDLKAGMSVYQASSSKDVVYIKRAFTGTLYDTIENIPTEITANLATGEVTVPAVAVDDAYQAETIAVIGRKADDSVKVETFTFGEDAYKTITLGSGYDKIFVWTWNDLVPLCDVIE